MATEGMNKFSIKDIENLTGIKAHTIRVWEQRYGILQPKRTPTNIRFYDAADLKLALRIGLLNSYGYKISRIHQMNDADMKALVQKITDRDFKLQLVVNELLEATLAMDTEGFETIISMYIKKNGMEQAIEQLIFHFLEKIGLMWISDRIFPAQEHLVSNIIYRKLAVAMEALPPRPPGAGHDVLLFLPEGEIHELALMYVNYLLLRYNKNPIYLGPNSPINDVNEVYKVFKPKYIYLHLTSVAETFDGNRYFKKLHTAFPDATILLSGIMLRSKKYMPFGNMRFLLSLQEVKEVLANI